MPDQNARDGRSDCSPASFAGILQARHRLLQAVRAFFCARDYLEVETPIRIPRPALEDHIDAEPAGKWYLRTSPELHMKRLLAAGYPRLFQLGPCFRKGEYGARHNPEYSMLEWYRSGVDYQSILDETRELIIGAAQAVIGSTRLPGASGPIDVAGDWLILPVREAFLMYAGWDPVKEMNPLRFDMDLMERVEPALPKDRPTVLMDYPVYLGALARRKPGAEELAERWELYVDGLELANAYSELIDPVEQRMRFELCAKGRASRGQEAYEPDEAFLAALSGMPEAGGIALGVDRLLMVLCGVRDLDQVLPFRKDT